MKKILSVSLISLLILCGCQTKNDNEQNPIEPTPPPTPQKGVNLSREASANTYIVSEPGDYFFDASLRGNGVGTTDATGFDPKITLAAEMTADWLWSTKEGLVTNIALDAATGKISFTAAAGTGNTLIALMSGGEIVWSWHIWMTDRPQEMPCANGTVFMDRNLGAIAATKGSSDAYGMYYQWGRKDPFYGGTTTETSAEAFKQAAANTVVNKAYASFVWGANTGSAISTVEYAAAHPMTFLYNKIGSTDYDWLAKSKNTLWATAKTMNDPCPVGYKVPDIAAWSGFSSGNKYIDGVSAWDATDYGMTYTHNGQTCWYPAQGSRNQSTGSLIGLGTTRSGNYWSNAPSSGASSKFFYFQKKLSSSSGEINPDLDKSRAFGYTVRCCKE